MPRTNACVFLLDAKVLASENATHPLFGVFLCERAAAGLRGGRGMNHILKARSAAVPLWLSVVGVVDDPVKCNGRLRLSGTSRRKVELYTPAPGGERIGSRALRSEGAPEAGAECRPERRQAFPCAHGGLFDRACQRPLTACMPRPPEASLTPPSPPSLCYSFTQQCECSTLLRQETDFLELTFCLLFCLSLSCSLGTV